jgi:LAGLIDADG endonuclease
MNELTEIQKAYIAGFFDGEGCISILKHFAGGKHKSSTYALTVILSQNGTIPLFEMLELTGVGSIHEKTQNPGSYNWQIRSIDASDFLKLILPYLKCKKEQAEVAIEFQGKQGHKNSTGRGYTVPLELSQEKETYYLKLQTMKGTSSKGRGRPKKI